MSLYVSEKHPNFESPITPQPKSKILSIHSDISLKILSFVDFTGLCQFAKTSRRARDLSNNETLWRNLNERSFQSPKSNDFKINLNNANLAFKQFLDSQVLITNPIIQAAVEKFPAVNSVEISADKEKVKEIKGSLGLIKNNYARLAAFSLKTNDVHTFSDVTDTDIDNFTSIHRHIKYLTLEGCSSVTESGLLAAINNCKDLSEISIESDHLTDKVIETLVTKHPHLTLLEIGGRHKVSDKSLKIIHEKCKNLKHLNIKNYNNVFSKSKVIDLLKKLKNLQSFTLKGCKQIDDEVFEVLAKHQPQIKNLELTGCGGLSEKGLNKLGDAPLLQTLKLRDSKICKKLQLSLQKAREKGLFSKLEFLDIKPSLWG